MQRETQIYTVFERVRYTEGEIALEFREQGRLRELVFPLQSAENPDLATIVNAITEKKQVKFSGTHKEFPPPPIGYAIAITRRLFSLSRKPIFKETLQRWTMHICRGEISVDFDRKYNIEIINGPWDVPRIRLERTQ